MALLPAGGHVRAEAVPNDHQRVAGLQTELLAGDCAGVIDEAVEVLRHRPVFSNPVSREVHRGDLMRAETVEKGRWPR